jgi:hypothetical protein
MQPVLDHLMAHGRWILSRQQLLPQPGMARLTAALAAAALATLRRLKARAIT